MILQLLGFACLAHLVADLVQSLNVEQLDRKPFNCNLCLGYWLSVVPLVILHGLNGFLLAAITGVLSETIYRLLNRL